jgi:hypothetical protein
MVATGDRETTYNKSNLNLVCQLLHLKIFIVQSAIINKQIHLLIRYMQKKKIYIHFPYKHDVIVILKINL